MSTVSAQNSTNSTLTQDEIDKRIVTGPDGKKYVLVPFDTFLKMERAIAELPLSREEANRLRAELANKEKLAASDAKIIANLRQQIEEKIGETLDLRNSLASQKVATALAEAQRDNWEREAKRLNRSVRWQKLQKWAAVAGLVAYLIYDNSRN